MKTLLILTCLFAISFSALASKNSSKAVHPHVQVSKIAIATEVQILNNKDMSQKFDTNKKKTVSSTSIAAKLFRTKTWRLA